MRRLRAMPAAAAEETPEPLPPVAAAAVTALRLWRAGPDGQAALWEAFARSFGPAEGRAHLKAVERFAAALGGMRAGTRPPGCPCLDAEERRVGLLVAAAAEGARDRAAEMATEILPGADALRLAARAEAAGLALRRLALRAERSSPAPPRPTHRASALRH